MPQITIALTEAEYRSLVSRAESDDERPDKIARSLVLAGLEETASPMVDLSFPQRGDADYEDFRGVVKRMVERARQPGQTVPLDSTLKAAFDQAAFDQAAFDQAAIESAKRKLTEGTDGSSA